MSPSSIRPPPLKSKLSPSLSQYQIEAQLRDLRNERARLRMAQKRAELKSKPLNEQLLAAERDREHQATYRERHKKDLRLWAIQRRLQRYQDRFGPEAFEEYFTIYKAQRKRRRVNAWIRAGYAVADIPGAADIIDPSPSSS
ncbi:hypothetical protein C8R46DRAFT_1031644 [Mycena filopes]|nr:hypothetical protein C8R46DRAFT_1031644 [Mycena filopes]